METKLRVAAKLPSWAMVDMALVIAMVGTFWKLWLK